eukprot:TRINITY_DN639_c0_g1_i1.p1 TRINITY_DN639_c0_g1~~TRINITY_DN639_c0_g1_i1.p1  ORF type:complete len:845 (-),score=262.54 TRINITY_DN639_c0_g1_i1:37-2571(-)
MHKDKKKSNGKKFVGLQPSMAPPPGFNSSTFDRKESFWNPSPSAPVAPKRASSPDIVETSDKQTKTPKSPLRFYTLFGTSRITPATLRPGKKNHRSASPSPPAPTSFTTDDIGLGRSDSICVPDGTVIDLASLLGRNKSYSVTDHIIKLESDLERVTEEKRNLQIELDKVRLEFETYKQSVEMERQKPNQTKRSLRGHPDAKDTSNRSTVEHLFDDTNVPDRAGRERNFKRYSKTITSFEALKRYEIPKTPEGSPKAAEAESKSTPLKRRLFSRRLFDRLEQEIGGVMHKINKPKDKEAAYWTLPPLHSQSKAGDSNFKELRAAAEAMALESKPIAIPPASSTDGKASSPPSRASPKLTEEDRAASRSSIKSDDPAPMIEEFSELESLQRALNLGGLELPDVGDLSSTLADLERHSDASSHASHDRDEDPTLTMLRQQLPDAFETPKKSGGSWKVNNKKGKKGRVKGIDMKAMSQWADEMDALPEAPSSSQDSQVEFNLNSTSVSDLLASLNAVDDVPTVPTKTPVKEKEKKSRRDSLFGLKDAPVPSFMSIFKRDTESHSVKPVKTWTPGEQVVKNWGTKEDMNKKGMKKSKRTVSLGKEGTKKQMEDVNLVMCPFYDDVTKALFCVFDGHLGRNCAQDASLMFPQIFGKAMGQEERKDLGEVFKTSFSRVDSILSQHEYEGTTATTVFVWQVGDERYLQSANVGDSSSFLKRKDRVVMLSKDHKATDADEKARIRASGGQIADGATRLGGLAVSRALGDHFVKNEHLGLISEPHISPAIRLEPTDTHLIVASDGLWDVMTGEEAMDMIEDMQSGEAAAKKLIQAALAKPKCLDNITVMVVIL